jgi:hypothetical protein
MKAVKTVTLHLFITRLNMILPCTQNITRRIFLSSDMMIFIALKRATCYAHGILFNLIGLIILGEEYTLLRF